MRVYLRRCKPFCLDLWQSDDVDDCLLNLLLLTLWLAYWNRSSCACFLADQDGNRLRVLHYLPFGIVAEPDCYDWIHLEDGSRLDLRDEHDREPGRQRTIEISENATAPGWAEMRPMPLWCWRDINQRIRSMGRIRRGASRGWLEFVTNGKRWEPAVEFWDDCILIYGYGGLAPLPRSQVVESQSGFAAD